MAAGPTRAFQPPCRQLPGRGRADGKRRMEQAWGQLQIELESALRRDPLVRPDAFDQAFTPEQFAGTLFSLMLSALVREDYDPAPVLELSRRLLY